MFYNKKPKIEYHESIESCPIRAYQKFNSYMIMGNETGDSLQDVYKRIDTLTAYINKNDANNTQKELNNLKMCLHHISIEYTPFGLANAAMVKSINGVECTDTTEEGLSKTLDLLSANGMTYEQIREKNDELKKKSSFSLKRILKRFSRLRI